MKNILRGFPDASREEVFTAILERPDIKLERIVSLGQSTPAGKWLIQDKNEWVLVLQGSAGLRFKSETQERKLTAGDCVNIPAQTPHRVEWTDKINPTVWLALHY